MHSKPLRIPFCLLSLSGVLPSIAAGEGGETFKVVREPFRIEVTLSGFLEAQKKSEVVLEPEVWAGHIVERAAEHGSRVKKGDPLIVFETEKIDEEIRDLKAAQELSLLALDQAEDDFRWFKESLPLDLAAALRAKEQADEDLRHFLDVEGPLSEKGSRISVEQARYSLEYASEELRQLEKMYKADDLTEETEEIILTRARREVENARFSLEATAIRSDHTLKVELPRQKDALLEGAKRKAMALGKTTAESQRTEVRKKLELLKAKSDQEKARIRIAKLEADRARMPLPSPQDGIVYYGKFNRGRWSDPAVVAEELKPGAAIAGRKVLMTVVEPRPLLIRADVPEKDLSLVRAGAEGTASPTSLPGVKPRIRVEKVAPVPMGPGLFDARIQVDLEDDAKELLPGMECPVKIVAYSNPKALTVPAAALFQDEPAGERPHVYIAGAGGKQEKRQVKAGRRTDAKVEILEGLQEGDEVLLKKPEEKAKL